MGKVWLETASGRLIHMNVVGDDVNSPDDVVKIPTSILVSANRCFSGQIQVVSPTHGTIIFDFDEQGRTGSCNQCGTCCGHPVADCVEPCGYILHEDLNWHVCQHLIIDKWRKWGDPNNSYCGILDDLLNVFKGCTTWPISQAKFNTYTWIQPYCGFSFS
jgi:hypothetical protein